MLTSDVWVSHIGGGHFRVNLKEELSVDYTVTEIEKYNESDSYMLL